MKILSVTLVGKEATVEIARRRWWSLWLWPVRETWRRIARVSYDHLYADRYVRSSEGEWRKPDTVEASQSLRGRLDAAVAIHESQERETAELLGVGDNVIQLRSARKA